MKDPGNLKIKSLSGDWCDKDIVMLHACFQLLTDCIEDEKLFTGHVDWTHDLLHIHTKHEILELYNWWKLRLEKEKEVGFDPCWSEGQYEEDDRMLIRLIKFRKYLWT